MSNNVPFQGGPGCPTFTVPVFGPLSIKDPSRPPEPIDAPVPAAPYIIPVPPPTPCTCLSFNILPEGGQGLKLIPPGQTPNGLSLAFDPVDETNCCDGRFNVTADLEIPCIPFTLNKAVADIKPLASPDGQATFSKFGFNQDGCTLTPEIELTLPCIPTPTYAYVVNAYDDGQLKQKLFEPAITNTPCEPALQTTIDIPCPIAVDTSVLKIDTGKKGTVNLQLEKDEDGCGVKLTATPDQQDLDCPITVNQSSIVTITQKRMLPKSFANDRDVIKLLVAKDGDCGIRLDAFGDNNGLTGHICIPAPERTVTDVTGSLEGGKFVLHVNYLDFNGDPHTEDHIAFTTLAHSRCMD